VKLASEFKEMFVAKNEQLKELFPKLIDVLSTMKGLDREDYAELLVFRIRYGQIFAWT